MEIFIGFGTHHITLRTKHIKRRIRLLVVKDKLEFISQGRQFAFDACARLAAARASFDTVFIACLLCLLIDVAEDRQQEVKLSLRHAG